mgnify:CR=1 FL=1
MNGKKAKLIRSISTSLADYKTLKRGYKLLKPRQLRKAINKTTMKAHSKDNYRKFIKPDKYKRIQLVWKKEL